MPYSFKQVLWENSPPDMGIPRQISREKPRVPQAHDVILASRDQLKLQACVWEFANVFRSRK